MNATFTALEKLEYDVVLLAINLRYGHDFQSYAQKSLMRRLLYHVEKKELANLSELVPLLIHDERIFNDLLNSVSIPVTEMFRDPPVFKHLREHVIPLLKTYPSIKIWHAGCATGEEVYSMAIMLEEENLYDKCKIFATDFNNQSLTKAQSGIFPLSRMQHYTENYYSAGGKSSFSDYYTIENNAIQMEKRLSRNIIFAKHNLMVDDVFGQFNLVLCRNVLIYFGRELQNRVLNLFKASIAPLGYLCLGTHESTEQLDCVNDFKVLFDKEKIYRKGN